MALLAQLRSLLGDDAVLWEPADMLPHVQDWRRHHTGHAACVVFPDATERVAQVVRLCIAHEVPVLPQGGNTSLCEGSVPRADSTPPVVLNLARMRRIRSVDEQNQSMVAEAGCLLSQVHEAALDRGLLYPVVFEAQDSCQIGGTIATNAGGLAALRWGTTRDNVLGLEVVLPDGRIWDGLGALRRDNSGLDLKQLFIGSEGTLGVVTAATLRLHPAPVSHATAWVAVHGPDQALALLGQFQQRCGRVLCAFEMMNALQLRLVTEFLPGCRAPLPVTHPWHVLVELSDSGGEQVLADMLAEVLEQGSWLGQIIDSSIAVGEPQRAALWSVRRAAEQANPRAGITLHTDCAVPVSAIPRFIARASAAVDKEVPGVPIAVVAHAGDGKVYLTPIVAVSTWRAWDDVAQRVACVREAIHETAIGLGGSFAAEDGVGSALLHEMTLYKSGVALDLMRSVKAALDPRGFFNPGRMLP